MLLLQVCCLQYALALLSWRDKIIAKVLDKFILKKIVIVFSLLYANNTGSLVSTLFGVKISNSFPFFTSSLNW